MLLSAAGCVKWLPVPVHEGSRLCHEQAGPLLRLVGGGGEVAVGMTRRGGFVSSPLPLPHHSAASGSRGPLNSCREEESPV